MGLPTLIRLPFLAYLLFAVLVMTTATSENNGTVGKALDANNLIAMGTKLNNPLLRLMGFTLQESFKEFCDIKKCADWSEWSDCSVKYKRSFGTRTRTRTCGWPNSSVCKSKSKSATETETGLCEGKCGHGYNVTAAGFCLRVIRQKVNQTTAEAMCNKNGGHLAHIDSKAKFDDAVTLIKSGSTGTFWVNGNRASSSSPWVYNDGSGNSGYFNWKSGEPSNGSSELCTVYELSNNVYYRYDRSCSGSSYAYFTMCESL